jgi:membrane protein DedA with SNARE-associated domain
MKEVLNWLHALAVSVPIEIFVLVGAVVEEILAPIPAPVVMGTAGYIAHQQGHGILFFFWLAIIGTIGKTFASWVFYLIGEKAGEPIVHSWGKYVGLNQKQLDRAHSWMNKVWWDEVLLVFLRVIPIIPTFILSIACGVIKIRMRTFLWTTFVGSVVRNFVIVWLGAMTTQYADQILQIQTEVTQQPLYLSFAIAGLLIGVVCALLIKKKLSRSKELPKT